MEPPVRDRWNSYLNYEIYLITILGYIKPILFLGRINKFLQIGFIVFFIFALSYTSFLEVQRNNYITEQFNQRYNVAYWDSVDCDYYSGLDRDWCIFNQSTSMYAECKEFPGSFCKDIGLEPDFFQNTCDRRVIRLDDACFAWDEKTLILFHHLGHCEYIEDENISKECIFTIFEVHGNVSDYCDRANYYEFDNETMTSPIWASKKDAIKFCYETIFLSTRDPRFCSDDWFSQQQEECQ